MNHVDVGGMWDKKVVLIFTKNSSNFNIMLKKHFNRKFIIETVL